MHYKPKYFKYKFNVVKEIVSRHITYAIDVFHYLSYLAKWF